MVKSKMGGSPQELLLLRCVRGSPVRVARIIGIVSRGFFRGVEDHAENMGVPQLLAGFLRRFGRSRIGANDEEHSIRQPAQHAGVGNRKGRRRIDDDPIKRWLDAIQKLLQFYRWKLVRKGA